MGIPDQSADPALKVAGVFSNAVNWALLSRWWWSSHFKNHYRINIKQWELLTMRMITIDNHSTIKIKQLTNHRSTIEHFINFHHKVLDVVPGTTLDFRSAKPEATTTRTVGRTTGGRSSGKISWNHLVLKHSRHSTSKMERFWKIIPNTFFGRFPLKTQMKPFKKGFGELIKAYFDIGHGKKMRCEMWWLTPQVHRVASPQL